MTSTEFEQAMQTIADMLRANGWSVKQDGNKLSVTLRTGVVHRLEIAEDRVHVGLMGMLYLPPSDDSDDEAPF